MAEEGDKGIVFSVDSPFSSFVEVPPAVVGDKVILYPLHSGDKLAVPSLDLELNGAVWVSPEWKDPVFDWQVPFIFDLIPLDLGPGYYTIRHLTDAYIIDDVKGAWTIDALIGKYVHIVAGTNAGDYYEIADNGDNWIGIDRTYTDEIENGDFSDGFNHWVVCQGEWSISDSVASCRLHEILSQCSLYHDGNWNGREITFKYKWFDAGRNHIVYITNGNCMYVGPYQSFVAGSNHSHNPAWPNWDTHTFTMNVNGFFHFQTLDTGFWRDVTFYLKDFSCNRVYDTLSAMGFAVGNLFEIVDSIP